MHEMIEFLIHLIIGWILLFFFFLTFGVTKHDKSIFLISLPDLVTRLCFFFFHYTVLIESPLVSFFCSANNFVPTTMAHQRTFNVVVYLSVITCKFTCKVVPIRSSGKPKAVVLIIQTRQQPCFNLLIAKICCHTCDGVMSRDVSFTTHWLAIFLPQPQPRTWTVSLSSCLSSLLNMS
jgi:hypothetical protein